MCVIAKGSHLGAKPFVEVPRTPTGKVNERSVFPCKSVCGSMVLCVAALRIVCTRHSYW